MKKIFLLSLLSLSLFAEHNKTNSDDLYVLTFNPDSNCTLMKNDEKIPSFDVRFKKKEPKNSYTCSALQKEQYNECTILKKSNITALFFGYGSYEYTNLILAFQNPHKSTKSSVTVRCSKKLSK